MRSKISFSMTVTWRRDRPKLASPSIPLSATTVASSVPSMTPRAARLIQIPSIFPATDSLHRLVETLRTDVTKRTGSG